MYHEILLLEDVGKQRRRSKWDLYVSMVAFLQQLYFQCVRNVGYQNYKSGGVDSAGNEYIL